LYIRGNEDLSLYRLLRCGFQWLCKTHLAEIFNRHDGDGVDEKGLL
jgi:hypothetical protein